MAKKFYARKSFQALLTLIIVASLVIYVFSQQLFHTKPLPPPITANGTLEADEVVVSTKIGARVSQVLAQEGQQVEAGSVLFKLDMAELESKRQEVLASLNEAQARLDLMNAGPRPEEVARAQAVLAEAEQNLNRYLKGARPEEVLEAEGNIRIAQAAHSQALREYERAKALFDSGDVPHKRLEAAESALETAKGQLEVAKQQRALVVAGPRAEETAMAREKVRQARAAYELLLSGNRREEIASARAAVERVKANLRTLETQLAESQITSPISGLITDLPVKSGEVVHPGQPLASIANNRQQRVDVYIEETKVGQLQINQTAEVRLPSFPGKTFKGRVASINETRVGERQTKETMDLRTVRVRVEIEPSDELLKPGMSVEVKISGGK